MRVEDFIKLYYGMVRIEVIGFDIIADKLRIFIRGCE